MGLLLNDIKNNQEFTMGSVIGKESVLEPTFKTLLDRPSTAATAYQIREYGTRFVAEVEYAGGDNKTGSPFRKLAKYIGVFGDAENEGVESMAMTAPVAMEKKGTKMAMTAPVAMERKGTPMAMTAPVAMESTDQGSKTMKFFLPAEYDSMEKIPKPTDSDVKIAEVPPQVGVVHRYSGSFSEKLHDAKAVALSKQLREDGIDRMTEEYVLQHYQFWGFNPPFTIPMFRRNEVWLELTPEEVEILQKKFEVEAMN